MSKPVPVRIMASYPLFGDNVEGKSWMTQVLREEQQDENISAYSVGAVGVSATTGVQTIDFTVVTELDISGTKAELKNRAREFLNGLVRDEDVTVHSVSTPF